MTFMTESTRLNNMTKPIAAMFAVCILSIAILYFISTQNEINSCKFDVEHLGAQSEYNYKELMFAYGLQDCVPANPVDDMCSWRLDEAIKKEHLLRNK